MLEDGNYVNANTFLTSPNSFICSDEDSAREETVSANLLSGSQLSAQAQYRVNYEHLVNDSMLEEDTSEVVDGTTTSAQPCSGKTMNLVVGPLLLLSPPTQATLNKRDLSTKFFQIYHQKKLLQDYSSPTTLFNLFFNNQVVEYFEKLLNFMLIEKKESIRLTSINLRCVFSLQFYCYLDTTYFHVESCIGKIAVT